MCRGVSECAAQLLGRNAQSLVARPHARSFGQQHGRQQMHVDVAIADRFVGPVNLVAFASRSSSMTIVVRICRYPETSTIYGVN